MKDLSKQLNICDRLSLIALCLFAGECVLGGSGRWLSAGSLSIRIALFAVCFLLTLPNVLGQMRKLCSNTYVIFALLLGFYLAIAAVVGWRRGNSLGFIKADITSYLTLALLPGFLATVCERKRLQLLLDIVFYCSLALGIITVGIHFYLAFASDWAVNQLNNWLNDHHMGGLANLGTGVLRIYMRSHIFLQVGILLGLHKLWSHTGWKRWLLLGGVALIAFACLLTYTRGFWLGLLASAVLLLVLAPAHWKRYFITVGVAGAMIVSLFLLSWGAYGKPLAAQEFVGRFNPDLISGAITPIDPTEPADPSDPTEPTEPDANLAALELRQKTLQELNRLIGENPVLGNGLGTNLDGIREDGKTEYMYHDTLMKIGIVGFLLFAMVFFLPAVFLLKRHLRLMKNRKKILWDSPEMGNAVLVSAYVGAAITSYVNPFLLNPMGILLVMLLAAADQLTTKETVL